MSAPRMSNAGKLGCEFHVPKTACLDVCTALWDADLPHGIADYGCFAMNAMRMEKVFKGALTNEVTLAEADVLRFARTDKYYMGRDKTHNAVLPWVCAYLEIDPGGTADGHGGEAVLFNKRVAGSTASVAFGPAVAKILAFAHFKPEVATPGTAPQVIIHGAPRAARVLGASAYEPHNLKPRVCAMVPA